MLKGTTVNNIDTQLALIKSRVYQLIADYPAIFVVGD